MNWRTQSADMKPGGLDGFWLSRLVKFLGAKFAICVEPSALARIGYEISGG
jgi:hypothetical protein